ncbi:acyl-CoA dehydrogenase family protein [Nocardia higoensis]|uniref:acyl-CoA dehydrogenase family protein n=1 Tax=Nocardia higoensis TaxID=228599 RepID=UPI0002E86FE1|nr:acyl-CoA dehydrogenase family protein [Nocardia higoensis]
MTGKPAEDDFGELHDELRAVARELIGKSGDGTVSWSSISGVGWPGLEAPEEFGGTAATIAETAVVLDEVGRAAARTALPSVLATTMPALSAVHRESLRDSLFRDAVAGTTVPIVVLDADRVAWSNAADPSLRLSDPGFRLTARPAGPVLDGSAGFVVDAPEADLLLVPAREVNGRIVLTVLDPGAAGLAVEPVPLVDATRSMGRVVATDVPVRAVWQPRTSGARLLRTLRARAALAVTCDALGTSAAVLDATVEYVRVREQFGRPVGSFQAVQHACANMLVQVTVARQLVAAAVRALVDARSAEAATAALTESATGDAPASRAAKAASPETDSEGAADRWPAARDPASALAAAELAVARAKAFTTAAAVDIAGKGLQLHGGFGYTWESGLHTHLKRATLNRTLFGLPAAHRKFIAAHYRQGPSAPGR